jgi:hypothetical protein
MLEVKSEKMVKYFFPKSFVGDLGRVASWGLGARRAYHCDLLGF